MTNENFLFLIFWFALFMCNALHTLRSCKIYLTECFYIWIQPVASRSQSIECYRSIEQGVEKLNFWRHHDKIFELGTFQTNVIVVLRRRRKGVAKFAESVFIEIKKNNLCKLNRFSIEFVKWRKTMISTENEIPRHYFYKFLLIGTLSHEELNVLCWS